MGVKERFDCYVFKCARCSDKDSDVIITANNNKRFFLCMDCYIEFLNWIRKNGNSKQDIEEL